MLKPDDEPVSATGSAVSNVNEGETVVTKDSTFLETAEEWVTWIASYGQSIAQYTGLQEPDDGSPNVVVRLVSNVEQYTGTLHESVLNPSVAVERMDNYIQGSTETETTTATESTNTTNQNNKEAPLEEEYGVLEEGTV